MSFVPADDGDDGRRHVVVQTDSTAWATQMRLLAATVVRRLNEELGDGTVRADRRPRARSAPSWKKGRRSVRDGRGPATPTAEPALTASAARLVSLT